MRANILSIIYRTTRYLVTRIIYLYQNVFFFPKDLEPAVRFGDGILGSFPFFKKAIFGFHIPLANSIKIHDLVFPSPLIGSSFKSEKKILEGWLQMGLGGLIFKTIMREKRDGNPSPRLQEVRIDGDRALVNALGLPGPGIDEFLKELPNSDLWSYGRPLGISIGGDHFDDYLFTIQQTQSCLKGKQWNYFYELNISCPNTVNGSTIGDNPEILDSLIGKIRKNISEVISVKISPDATNIRLNEIGEVCASHDSMLVNAGNTQFKTRSDLNLSKKDFSMNGGGLSGPAIFTRTLEMVTLFSSMNLPVIATGGISNYSHLNALKNAGASLFGMATSLVLDPYCIPRMNTKLEKDVYDRPS